MDNIQLFIFTVKEYKRFANKLNTHKMTDTYDELAYIETNTKLMLLRKYGNVNENVYVGKVVKNAIKKYLEKKEELNDILSEYNKIEKQQLEYIAEDGTKLNLYETIEDVMYGMYLHADENRIKRLVNAKEDLRFVCVRKYVEELEKVVFSIYACLKEYEVIIKSESSNRASTIYLGDNLENQQKIKNSSYWSNLYGRDGTNEDLEQIIKDGNLEDNNILLKCLIFTKELQKEKISINTMNSLIFPTTKPDWGDYLEAQTYYKAIKNPGFSSKVRYNNNHTMAYVRIFPQVDDIFIIDTPHIINEIYEICLVKETLDDDWKIYSFGGHLESYMDDNK